MSDKLRDGGQVSQVSFNQDRRVIWEQLDGSVDVRTYRFLIKQGVGRRTTNAKCGSIDLFPT